MLASQKIPCRHRRSAHADWDKRSAMSLRSPFAARITANCIGQEEKPTGGQGWGRATAIGTVPLGREPPQRYTCARRRLLVDRKRVCLTSACPHKSARADADLSNVLYPQKQTSQKRGSMFAKVKSRHPKLAGRSPLYSPKRVHAHKRLMEAKALFVWFPYEWID